MPRPKIRPELSAEQQAEAESRIRELLGCLAVHGRALPDQMALEDVLGATFTREPYPQRPQFVDDLNSDELNAYYDVLHAWTGQGSTDLEAYAVHAAKSRLTRALGSGVRGTSVVSGRRIATVGELRANVSSLQGLGGNVLRTVFCKPPDGREEIGGMPAVADETQ